MRNFLGYILVICFAVISSCEPASEKIFCYPSRVTTTTASGTGSASVISDYHYDGDTLRYIIYSTGQAHYYEYDNSGRLLLVKEINDKSWQKDEYALNYDGDELLKIDIFLMRLDYADRTDLDTFQYTFREFEYEGGHIIRENYYSREADTVEFSLAMVKEYTYDTAGNITEIHQTDKISKEEINISMAYDTGKNPFSALNLMFNGEESYVNNLLTKTNDRTGATFQYTVVYNGQLYPEQTIEKENGNINRIERFDYDCR